MASRALGCGVSDLFRLANIARAIWEHEDAAAKATSPEDRQDRLRQAHELRTIRSELSPDQGDTK